MEELACALQEFGFCTPLQYFTKISDTPEFKRNTFKKMIHSAKFSKKSEKKITSPDKNVKRRSNDLEGGKEQTLGYVKKVIGGTRRSASR